MTIEKPSTEAKIVQLLVDPTGSDTRIIGLDENGDLWMIGYSLKLKGLAWRPVPIKREER